MGAGGCSPAHRLPPRLLGQPSLLPSLLGHILQVVTRLLPLPTSSHLPLGTLSWLPATSKPRTVTPRSPLTRLLPNPCSPNFHQAHHSAGPGDPTFLQPHPLPKGLRGPLKLTPRPPAWPWVPGPPIVAASSPGHPLVRSTICQSWLCLSLMRKRACVLVTLVPCRTQHRACREWMLHEGRSRSRRSLDSWCSACCYILLPPGSRTWETWCWGMGDGDGHGVLDSVMEPPLFHRAHLLNVLAMRGTLVSILLGLTAQQEMDNCDN